MQFINTQYKVMSLEKEDKYGSTFLIEDTTRSNLIKNMRVINVQKETQEFIEYMKLNLYDYKNLNHINLSEYFFFNKINVIDRKPVVTEKYYFTYESLKGQSLFEFVKDKSFDVLLDLAIQLCTVVKYLHLRGYILCNISIDELVVVQEKQKNILKLMSIPYIEGTENSVMFDKDNINFKSPEVMQDERYTYLSDIYLIGVIFFYMFSGKYVEDSHFREDLSQPFINTGTEFNIIKKIIRKCTALRPIDRYNTIEQIVDDINNKFDKNFNIIDKRYIQVLPRYMTKLISREKHIQRMINNIKGYLFDDKSNRVSIIKGDIGTGKNAFLTCTSYRLEQEGINVVIDRLNENLRSSFYIITYVVKEIIKYLDKELIDKYLNDLSRLIPELMGSTNQQVINDILDKQNKVRLIYRLGNFLLEASGKHPFVLIINSFEWIDEDSHVVLDYIIKNENKGKIYFIISVDKEAIDEFADSKNLYCSLGECENTDTIELTNLNINETAEYIRLLLGMKKAPLDFAANIYKETEGNPNYIYEVIYLLYVNNYIYVDNNGEWVFSNVDFNSIKLSINIDEIILNKINRLTPIQKEIIRVMSVFNTAASMDILEGMLDIKGEELFVLLTYLTSINILSRKVDDWGISFDFSSINLKKSIYEKISQEDKLKYHKKASYKLENKFEKENRENKDELIYHMTKANRYDEAIDHLLFSAEKMIASNLINQAIQFLEQTYSLFEKREINSKKIIVCSKLGELYEQLGEYKRAEYFYDVVENIAEALNDKLILINVYNRKFSLLYKLNENKSSIKYAISAKRLLKKISYAEGLYELILSMGDMSLYKRKYNSYLKILEKLLKDDNLHRNEIYYARILSLYGRYLYHKNRYEESLKALLASVEILEKISGYKYLPPVLNSIGVIYTDYYNDVQKSREYYEKSLSISQKMNNLRTMGNCYNNLAETYRIEDRYLETIEYYNKALDVVRISKNLYFKVLLYGNLVLVNMAVEDYKKAAEYMNDCEGFSDELKDTGNLIEYLYRCKAELYYYLGDFEQAKAYAQKAVDMCISWGISVDLEADYIRILSESMLNINFQFEQHLEFCNRIFGDNLYKLGRVACIRLAEIYTDKNMYNEASSFIELGRSYINKIDTEVLRLEYEYIDIAISSKENKLNRLISLSMVLGAVENNEIKCKIYRAVADEFMNRQNYQEALKYYISSLNFLRKLVNNVPEENKINFVTSHNRHKIKQGLMKASEMLTLKRGKKAASDKEGHLSNNEKAVLSIDNIDKYFDYTGYIDIYRYRENNENGAEHTVDVYTYNFKMQELISKFGENNIGNLKDMINMFTEITKAKSAFIATLDEDDNINVLASYNRYFELPFYKYIIEQVKQKKDSIIVTDAFEYSRKKGDILIPKDITAVFCIPIMGAKEDESVQLLDDKRRGKLQTTNHVIGYIYMDTDSIINNFTEESSQFCITASKLSYLLVDNYNLRIVSAIDKLTKLYTRKYFETALINELVYAEKENGEFCILMIDIDKFKTVNDRFGHQKGDEILQNVSSIIMSSVRKGDICARYGGEEIIVLLPGTNGENGHHVAEKIRRKVENSKLLGLHNPLTISLGVASYPEHSTWAKDLIEKADQALYYAKESGRNMSCLYQQNMSKSLKRIDKLAGIISGNLVEDQRKVESMLEVLELQRNSELSFDEKIFKFLGRIIEVSEAQTGIIYHINNKKETISKIARKKFIDTEIIEVYYSEGIVKKCIEKEAGEYVIDWSNYPGIDSVTGMPDWQSIIAVPFIKGGIMRGLLYLSVSVKDKEFDAGAFNFIKTLCDIISAIY